MGHALAYARRWSGWPGATCPRARAWLRVVLLELERLYNHVGDVGMIANDTGYAWRTPIASGCASGSFRLNERLTGNRLMRGAIVPGGVGPTCRADLDLAARGGRGGSADFTRSRALCLAQYAGDGPAGGHGTPHQPDRARHGRAGIVARASGIDADVRRDHPFAAYGELDVRVPVYERRRREGADDGAPRRGARVGAALQPGLDAPARGARSTRAAPRCPRRARVGLVEGWRGAILHWVMADGAGRFAGSRSWTRRS